MPDPGSAPSGAPRASPVRRGFRLRFRTRLALAFGLVTVLITALAVWLSYGSANRSVIREFGDGLKSVAAGAAQGIDGDAFARLREPEQMASPAYRRIQEQLRRNWASNPHFRLRFLYTLAPAGEPGVWRYVVDAEDPRAEDFSPLGSTEDYRGDVQGEVFARTLTMGLPQAEQQVNYDPQWGALLTAAAPIRDGAGRVVGLVGVDATARTVADMGAEVRWTALLCLAGGLLLSTVTSFLIAWQVTRPLETLQEGAQAVAGGDLSHQVQVASRDEFGDLALAFNEMTAGLRERELYRQQFERYVSRQIAEKVLADPERAFWHGERRRATILFSDIRGFTAMSERLPPEEVIRHLNEYLAVMVDIVFRHEGTLDKFIGDAIMAVFGAPVSLGNDEERAVRVAVEMQQAVGELRRRWEAEGVPSFQIGIGVNTGEVVVGNIGSERRLEYGAIGDHVNLASRLEALNKEYGTGILISESTYEVVSHLIESRCVGRVAVRGREQPIRVYEVLGLRD